MPTQAAEPCFQETGYCIQGRFLDYWQENGGLARNGFPLTAERREVLEDGKEYTVQYFERVRMELHPENAPPYDVLLGQFGRQVLRESFGVARFQYDEALTPVPPQPGMVYFPETGHNVSPEFYAYWQANGGLAQFGYPLAEAVRYGGVGDPSRSEQYFERGRLEEHPENAGTPYTILLGQFGRAVLERAARYQRPVAAPFASLYAAKPALREDLGPPADEAVVPSIVTGPAEILAFEHGLMLRYRGDGRQGGIIQVLCGTAEAGVPFQPSRPGEGLANPWREGSPAGGSPGPRPGTYEPKYGFGLLWQVQPYRDCLGYALAPDAIEYVATSQRFETGWLITMPDGESAYAVDRIVRADRKGGHYQRFALPR